MPNVTLVVCAAPLSSRTVDIATYLMRDAWSVSIVGTPSSAAWLDIPLLVSTLGSPPRIDYRTPDQNRSAADPDAVVVCPATFNTVNKVAAGIADNYAVSLICESVGAGLPVLMAPMVNDKLWRHTALPGAIEALSKSGVRFMDLQSGEHSLQPIQSGSGAGVVESFQPRWLAAALREMLSGAAIDT
ncbi:flavoprotein [Krasilnikovia cinnamomea]|uniref:Flavoprotein n=1 Tax=Krasilnikovia cinnamomea TaxID=349313 RepID=A0A4Q7ZF11_9ACTN|nr:flavoprotein [Krasilnikovia cinnamomea]RZU49342.1 flavoprotein [Krasilnikovia cinnamomea]